MTSYSIFMARRKPTLEDLAPQSFSGALFLFCVNESIVDPFFNVFFLSIGLFDVFSHLFKRVCSSIVTHELNFSEMG